MTRDQLYEQIRDHLNYATNTSKIRWIMTSNGWETAEDVRDNATDAQIKAIPIVWGPDAFAV